MGCVLGSGVRVYPYWGVSPTNETGHRVIFENDQELYPAGLPAEREMGQ